MIIMIRTSAEFYLWTLQNRLFVCSSVFVCVCVFPSDRQIAQFLLGLHNLNIAQLYLFWNIIHRPSDDSAPS